MRLQQLPEIALGGQHPVHLEDAVEAGDFLLEAGGQFF